MKFYEFSFKNEAVWSTIFNLVGFAVGGVILLLIYLVRWLS